MPRGERAVITAFSDVIGKDPVTRDFVFWLLFLPPLEDVGRDVISALVCAAGHTFRELGRFGLPKPGPLQSLIGTRPTRSGTQCARHPRRAFIGANRADKQSAQDCPIGVVWRFCLLNRDEV